MVFENMNIYQLHSLSEGTPAILDTSALVIQEYSAHGLYHPSKICWRLSVTTEEYTAVLKSSKRRRVIRTHEKYKESGLRMEWEEELSEAGFQNFLRFYIETMSKLPKGKIHLTPEWYSHRIHELKKRFSGIHFFKGEQYYGGALIEHKEDALDICYAAYTKSSLQEMDLGLGAIVISNIYNKAKSYGYQHIGYGRDTNMYGYHLSLDLLRYKRWYGFFPTVPTDIQLFSYQTIFFLQSPIDPIAIFTTEKKNNSNLSLILIQPQDRESVDIQAYCPEGMSVQSMSGEILSKEHRTYIESLITGV